MANQMTSPRVFGVFCTLVGGLRVGHQRIGGGVQVLSLWDWVAKSSNWVFTFQLLQTFIMSLPERDVTAYTLQLSGELNYIYLYTLYDCNLYYIYLLYMTVTYIIYTYSIW